MTAWTVEVRRAPNSTWVRARNRVQLPVRFTRVETAERYAQVQALTYGKDNVRVVPAPSREGSP
jgi:hypothetical protein